ncbi:hypothetical protein [Peribacillus muralis]|uniref:hypothetical protein n=1 Tax=Peribacillus muralis TaxID=264697 RepID=UPI003CFBE424
MAVFDTEQDILSLELKMDELKKLDGFGVIVTAAEVSNGKNMVWHYHPLSGYDRNGKGIRIEGAHAFYGGAK